MMALDRAAIDAAAGDGSVKCRRPISPMAAAMSMAMAPTLKAPPRSKKKNGFVIVPPGSDEDVADRRVEPHEIEEITPNDLAEIIRGSCLKVLILDCRSFLDFNVGHVINAVNVWCSKLLNRRLQQNKVTAQEVLRNTFHLEVGEAELVVIYDQDSPRVADLESQGFTKTLMDKLRQSFPTVAFLKGGFTEFQNEHPDLCSDSSRWRPILKTLSNPCLASSCYSPGDRGTRATRILPFLYLGSEQDALDLDFLQSHNIEYVLNLSLQIPKPSAVQDSHFMRIPVHDSPNEKLLPHFLQAFQFLDMVQEVGGNVLVHCFAGISRSPTLVIGYVMDRLHLSSEEAFRYVKSKRAVVAPNFNFLGQLLEYDQHLKTRLKTNLHKVHTAPATSAPLEFSWELPPPSVDNSQPHPPGAAAAGPRRHLLHHRRHPHFREPMAEDPVCEDPKPQQLAPSKTAHPNHVHHQHQLHLDHHNHGGKGHHFFSRKGHQHRRHDQEDATATAAVPRRPSALPPSRQASSPATTATDNSNRFYLRSPSLLKTPNFGC